jgi:hypothetical protein
VTVDAQAQNKARVRGIIQIHFLAADQRIMRALHAGAGEEGLDSRGVAARAVVAHDRVNCLLECRD